MRIGHVFLQDCRERVTLFEFLITSKKPRCLFDRWERASEHVSEIFFKESAGKYFPLSNSQIHGKRKKFLSCEKIYSGILLYLGILFSESKLEVGLCMPLEIGYVH
jgi:hypothetical protein